jgi:hypothetical protein
MRPPGRLAACALALAAVFSVALPACGGPAAPSAASLKLFIAEAGLYRLTRDELRQAGFALQNAALPRLQLTHHDQAVPLQIEQNGDDFSVFFYAVPEAGPYSPADVYWLRVGTEPGLRMAAREVEPPRAESAPAAFAATLRLEEDLLYFPNVAGETHWYWRSLPAPSNETFTFTLPAFAGGEGQIQIALAGLTEGPHHLAVLVNGQPEGEAAWDGGQPYLFQAAASALLPGDNTLSLNAPGAAGAAEINLVDWIAVEYPRRYAAQDGALEFDGAGGDIRLEGFPGETVAVYDITNPQAAQQLAGYETARAGEALSVAYYDPLPGRFLALAPGAARRPAEIRPATLPPRDLRAADQQADYLIVAPAEFFDALQPLARHRAETGLSVQLVDIEHVYDAFSGGRPDPQALRDFLAYTREAWGAPAPRFVLLVGKASYDYRDNLGGSNKNLVPTYLVATLHLGQAASDNWFVAQGADDLTPTMALGRLPAETPAQVKIAVDKIIAYEAGLASGGAGWRSRAVFAADDEDPAFDLSSDALAGALPPAIAADKIYLSAYGGDVEATRAEIVRAWNEGALLLTYIGHGAIDTWAAGPLFGSQHLGEIRNGDRLPILLTPTCLDGFFYHPEKDSLTEALLFKTGGGIVAGLVPTGLSLPGAQDALMEALFAELFAQPAPTLGEAILRARQKVDDQSPAVREVLETFVLLGDPALRWRALGS